MAGRLASNRRRASACMSIGQAHGKGERLCLCHFTPPVLRGPVSHSPRALVVRRERKPYKRPAKEAISASEILRYFFFRGVVFIRMQHGQGHSIPRKQRLEISKPKAGEAIGARDDHFGYLIILHEGKQPVEVFALEVTRPEPISVKIIVFCPVRASSAHCSSCCTCRCNSSL